jgi:putative transposase
LQLLSAQPLLDTPRRRDLLLTALDQVRQRYEFVVGYVIMPEHIHLLISEPQEKLPRAREAWGRLRLQNSKVGPRPS